MLTEFSVPGFRRLKPNGLLVPYPNDPRLRAYRREEKPCLTKDGRILPRIEGASASTYIVYNSAMVTTAAPVKQPTGTAIRTMIELAPQSSPSTFIRVIEWGCSFDAIAAATPGEIELIDTGTIFVNTITTAYAAADIQPYGNSKAPANTASTTGVPLALGTSLSGFATAAPTGEGTITATRMGDVQLIAPTSQYVKQFPLGREFEIPGGDALRIRMTFAASVNTYCYIIFEA